MAMGKRRARQQELWIAAKELPRTRGHVFYDRANEILNNEGFDGFAEKECVRVLQERNDGAAKHRAGRVFPNVDGWIFRRSKAHSR